MVDPVSSIQLEYLMTLHVALEPERRVTSELSLFPGRAGGWVRGPAINGEIVPPSGDWLRKMRDGVCRLDVRLAILADDGSHILMTYLGRITAPSRRRVAHPTWPGGEDTNYFLIGAAFETESDKYGWLNDIVAVGKNVPGPEGGVTHELYAAI